MIEANFFNLYYYISQALLGYITNNIRAISVKYDKEASQLFMYIYLENTPSLLDKESVYSALSEAESMFSERINYDAEFITTTGILTKDDMKDFWIYMRYEAGTN